jgi:hypothetical protein
MSDSITRIADLPENGLAGSLANGETNYIPINVHPNPYGNNGQAIQPPAQPSYSPPVSVGSAAPEKQNIQIQYQGAPGVVAPGGGEQQYRLPSRDIPMDPAFITQDTEVKPNYVPPATPVSVSDYVKEYEERKLAKIQEHKAKNHRAQMADDWFSEIQVPLFITILFFVFQMPIVNNLLQKYLPFLAIYHADGNLNVYGLLLKSLFFGSVYYSISKGVDYLTVL